jgi:hypothetical protein
MALNRKSNILAWHIDVAGAVVCAGLAAIAHFGVIRPIMNRQNEAKVLELEIGALQEQTDAMRGTARRMQTALDDARVALADVDLTLQPAEQMNRRLADIVTLAGECGMVIDETRTDEIQRHTNHSTIPVGLSGGGSYSACAKVLNALAGRLPDVKVLAFELSNNTQRTSGNDRFTFDLAWYAAPSSATAAVTGQ